MPAQSATWTIRDFAGIASLDPADPMTAIGCGPNDVGAIGDRYGFLPVIQYDVLTHVNQNSSGATRHSKPGRSRCPSPCASGAATETGT